MSRQIDDDDRGPGTVSHREVMRARANAAANKAPAPRRKGDKSGKHSPDSPRRKLSAPAEAWLLWDLAAEHDQRSFADWARGVLTVAAAEALKIDPVTALEAIGE